ncbi:MAG TPA: hypothetical protein VKX17_05740 [Planctomycetota bacterium]|nr:hypothetical protein [Planctomycetota bacterium]
MNRKRTAKSRTRRQCALCLDNSGYEGSLSVGKVYPVLPDAKAAEVNYIRVVDDSGEDYVFHSSHFAFLDLPAAIQSELKAAYSSSVNGHSPRARTSAKQARNVATKVQVPAGKA